MLVNSFKDSSLQENILATRLFSSKVSAIFRFPSINFCQSSEEKLSGSFLISGRWLQTMLTNLKQDG